MILQIGDPRLIAPNKKITINDDLKYLIKQLEKEINRYNLIGIAAPQVGLNVQMFITKLNNKLEIFINPNVLELSKDKTKDYEGCGSYEYGKKFGIVERSNKIKIEYWDKKWRKKILIAKNMFARVIQHEYDHLQGILCVDKME